MSGEGADNGAELLLPSHIEQASMRGKFQLGNKNLGVVSPIQLRKPVFTHTLIRPSFEGVL